MAALNKAQIIGYLGKDPETGETQNGVTYSNFSIATSEKWKDRDGNTQERTEWHNIVVYDKLAQVCNEYLSKGSQVYVEGPMRTRSWEDKDGSKRYTTEIIARAVQFLDRKEGGGDRRNAPPPEDDYGYSGGGKGGSDDDVPF